MSWYQQSIDSNIQQLVYYLRNNGFNTISSCGHSTPKYILIQPYRHNEKELLEYFLQRIPHRLIDYYGNISVDF